MSDIKKFNATHTCRLNYLKDGKFVDSNMNVTLGFDASGRPKILVTGPDKVTHSGFLKKRLTPEQRKAVVEYTNKLTAEN